MSFKRNQYIYFYSRHNSHLVNSFKNLSTVILIGISFKIIEFLLFKETDSSIYFCGTSKMADVGFRAASSRRYSSGGLG